MSPIKTVFSLVFALLITGCASSPTQFASPDVENGTYTIGEGETLKPALFMRPA
jgi:major membrane immunogen (membrane-anchored lipoprotein)